MILFYYISQPNIYLNPFCIHYHFLLNVLSTNWGVPIKIDDKKYTHIAIKDSAIIPFNTECEYKISTKGITVSQMVDFDRIYFKNGLIAKFDKGVDILKYEYFGFKNNGIIGLRDN